MFPAVPSTTVPPGLSLHDEKWNIYIYIPAGHIVREHSVMEQSRETGKERTTNSPTVGLCCFNDAERGSVLHATAGVLEFCFAVYF